MKKVLTKDSRRGNLNSMEPNGNKRGRKPLSDEHKQKIRELRQLNWNLADIAKAVGCGIGTVHKVLKEN